MNEGIRAALEPTKQKTPGCVVCPLPSTSITKRGQPVCDTHRLPDGGWHHMGSNRHARRSFRHKLKRVKQTKGAFGKPKTLAAKLGAEEKQEGAQP